MPNLAVDHEAELRKALQPFKPKPSESPLDVLSRTLRELLPDIEQLPIDDPQFRRDLKTLHKIAAKTKP